MTGPVPGPRIWWSGGDLGSALRSRHVWQKNCGFRAAEIRNRALLACQGDYCVFLDGDCLAPTDFIATHRKLAEPGWFVTGNRVLLSPALTAAVLRDGLHPEAWNLSRWLGHRKRGGVNRLAGVLRLPLGPLRKLGARHWRGARSCNLAVWRSDIDRVDGFDASFSGWGREDLGFAGSPAALRTTPQGWALCHRRHSPLACPGRPCATGRQ